MKSKNGTLNERLVLNGQMKNFERALKKKNRHDLISILQSVGLGNPDVDFLIENYNATKRNFLQRLFGTQ